LNINCGQQNSKNEMPGLNTIIPFRYTLEYPDKYFDLPEILNEISGLSFMQNGNLATVQDELGIVFIIDTSNGNIIQQIDTGLKGDFEGIEIVDNNGWLVKSNGTLIEIKHFLTPHKLKVVEHKTQLTKKNNVEGLAFDPRSGKLLLAIKNEPGIQQKIDKSTKVVYAFDPQSRQLDEQPSFIIRLDSIEMFYHASQSEEAGKKVLKALNKNKQDHVFSPSGIAVHPLTGNIYVIASSGKKLLVLNPKGRILNVVKLGNNFAQPEGICFDPTGNLYISNEANKSIANIQKFILKNNPKE
jgi:uncharacterized protein YjiK